MKFLQNITPKQWIIIAVVIIVIIVLIYYFNKPKTITTSTTITPVIPSNNTITNSINGFPLQIGSRGPDVVKWQHYLNSKGANLKEDGIWGPLTEAASLKYMGFNSVTEQYFKGLGL